MLVNAAYVAGPYQVTALGPRDLVRPPVGPARLGGARPDEERLVRDRIPGGAGVGTSRPTPAREPARRGGRPQPHACGGDDLAAEHAMTRRASAAVSLASLTLVAFILGLLVVVQLRGQSGVRPWPRRAPRTSRPSSPPHTENDRLLVEWGCSRTSSTTSARIGQPARRRWTLTSDLNRVRAWVGLDPIAAGTPDHGVSARSMPRPSTTLRRAGNAGAVAIAIDETRVIPRTKVSGVPARSTSMASGSRSIRRPCDRQAVDARRLAHSGRWIVAQLGATNPGATVYVEPVDEPIPCRDPARPRAGHCRPRL